MSHLPTIKIIFLNARGKKRWIQFTLETGSKNSDPLSNLYEFASSLSASMETSPNGRTITLPSLGFERVFEDERGSVYWYNPALIQRTTAATLAALSPPPGGWDESFSDQSLLSLASTSQVIPLKK